MSDFALLFACFALGWTAATFVYLALLLFVVCWRILTDE